MKTRSLLALCLAASLLQSPAFAAEPKYKVLDSFKFLDPKSTKQWEVKSKIASTQDPAHSKVLDLQVDFAKPGTWPSFRKYVLEGTFKPSKYSGIRFFARSESSTEFDLVLGSDRRTPEGRSMSFVKRIKATPEWTEFKIPFEEIRTWNEKFWDEKLKTQKQFPGGEPIPAEEYAELKWVGFGFFVEGRGSSTVAKVQIDELSLMEK